MSRIALLNPLLQLPAALKPAKEQVSAKAKARTCFSLEPLFATPEDPRQTTRVIGGPGGCTVFRCLAQCANSDPGNTMICQSNLHIKAGMLEGPNHGKELRQNSNFK